MGGYFACCQVGSFMVNQWRYARRRQLSMNSGSAFFPEMTRMISSLSPGGTVSVSMSETKPYLYSLLTNSSIVSVAVLILILQCYRAGAGCDAFLEAGRARAGRGERAAQSEQDPWMDTS